MTYAWVKKLNDLIAEKGWSVAEYVRRVNSDPSKRQIGEAVIRKYLEGKVENPRGDTIDRLGEPFGKSHRDLRFDITNISSEGRQFPLLTLDQLGTNGPAQSNGVREESSLTVFSDSVGPNCFGVVIVDDACAPKIRKGSIAFCDPDAEVLSGNFVIARIPDLGIGVCRRYRQKDGRDPAKFILKPEDEDYPEYESSADSPIEVWRIVKVLSDL